MLLNAVIVGFTVAFAKFTDWWFSSFLSRPIFIVALLGILLGQPKEGIILGAELELVFLGNVSLGGVMPSDYSLGSIFGGAFAILLHTKLATAVALAVPISLLGTLIYTLMKMVITSLVPKFEKYIKDKNIKGFNRLWHFQFWGFEIVYFLLGFFTILAGTAAVKAFVDAIPSWIQNSMNVAAGMLPAVGLALLLKMLWDKSLSPYYFLGFALGAFFTVNLATGGTIAKGAVALTTTPTKMLNLVQIAVFGFIIAAIVVINEVRVGKSGKNDISNKEVKTEESEDFFND